VNSLSQRPCARRRTAPRHARLSRQLPAPGEISLVGDEVAEVGVAATALGRADLLRDPDALLQLDQAAQVALVGARGADVVQRVSADLVEPERLRHRQRLLPGCDCEFAGVGEHVVAGDMAEDQSLRRGGPQRGDELRGRADVRRQALAVTLVECRVGEQDLRLGGRLTIACRHERVARLQEQLASHSRPVARFREPKQQRRTVGSTTGPELQCLRVEARRCREGVEPRGPIAGLSQRNARTLGDRVGRLACCPRNSAVS
jgi:hypothetical protein